MAKRRATRQGTQTCDRDYGGSTVGQPVTKQENVLESKTVLQPGYLREQYHPSVQAVASQESVSVAQQAMYRLSIIQRTIFKQLSTGTMLGLRDCQSWAIFITYMAFSINLGLLVTATKDKDNKYNYNTTTVVLLSECLKFVTSIVFYLRNNTIQEMCSAIRTSYKAMFLYFIPSFLYCLYNNLAFVNLAEYDPSSYFILLQFRMVLSAIIFQLLFQQKLTKVQWLSMFLLTLGCIGKEFDHQQIRGQFLTPSIFFIILQVFCSCFAGVYTEYLLKGHTSCGKVEFWIQNMFMCADSVVCNVLFLLLSGNLGSALRMDSMKSVLQLKVIAVICNNAAMGIVTALFLKNLNSILKNFASAIEIVLLTVLSLVLFNIPITKFSFMSTCSVLFAVQLYSRNPVINQDKSVGHENGQIPIEDQSKPEDTCDIQNIISQKIPVVMNA